MSGDLFMAILADKLATFLTGGLVFAAGLLMRYAVTNYLAGKRLREMGFQYDPYISYRGLKCKIVNIFTFKTIIKRLDTGEVSSPIKNEKLEDEVVWMEGNGHSPSRRKEDHEKHLKD